VTAVGARSAKSIAARTRSWTLELGGKAANNRLRGRADRKRSRAAATHLLQPKKGGPPTLAAPVRGCWAVSVDYEVLAGG